MKIPLSATQECVVVFSVTILKENLSKLLSWVSIKATVENTISMENPQDGWEGVPHQLTFT